MIGKVWLFLFAFFLMAGAAQAGSQANLCNTTMAGACWGDVEWHIGWFWAHNEPSVASCATYHHTFGGYIGDIWGFCNEIGMPHPDTPTASYSGGDSSSSSGQSLHPRYVVTLNTSYGSGKCELPPDGVEDDYTYDTSSCQTDF